MIKELNILRIIFMLMIFLEHSAFLSGGGYLGVALFFMLGGFCMTLGYYDKVQKEEFCYRAYITKRAIKFYPLHWACLVAWVIIAFASSQPIGGVGPLMANVLLVQSWIPSGEYFFSFNGISWYLADTVFFTLVFPLIVNRIVSKSVRANMVFVTILTVFYVLMCFFVPVELRHALLYINPLTRLIDFVLGIYLARGFVIFSRLNPETCIKSPVCIFAAIISLVILLGELKWWPEMMRFSFIFWIPAAVLIFSIAVIGTNRASGNRIIDVLSECGQYVFSFYMIHQLMITVCNSLAHKTHFEHHFWVMLITLVLTSLLAVACKRMFEKPVADKLNKMFNV